MRRLPHSVRKAPSPSSPQEDTAAWRYPESLPHTCPLTPERAGDPVAPRRALPAYKPFHRCRSGKRCPANERIPDAERAPAARYRHSPPSALPSRSCVPTCRTQALPLHRPSASCGIFQTARRSRSPASPFHRRCAMFPRRETGHPAYSSCRAHPTYGRRPVPAFRRSPEFQKASRPTAHLPSKAAIL